MAIIRKAKAEDAQQIVAFQQEMAFETEGLHLDKNILLSGVTAAFEHPEKGRYFLAQIDDKVVASLMITYEWSDWRSSTIFWIQSVFVQKAYRRQGIYRQLYDHVKTIAESDSQIGGIRLYVDKTNLTAQKTYANLGMNGEHYQVFEWMK